MAKEENNERERLERAFHYYYYSCHFIIIIIITVRCQPYSCLFSRVFPNSLNKTNLDRMFRMEGMEASADEKARVRKDVQSNICTFAMLCLAIRFGSYRKNL